jgi:HD-like signal output (HDOD) protein
MSDTNVQRHALLVATSPGSLERARALSAHPEAARWRLTVIHGGAALSLALRDGPADALVVLGGVAGSDLEGVLRKVRQDQPHVARLSLHDHPDPTPPGLMQRWDPDTWDARSLEAALERGTRLHAVLTQPGALQILRQMDRLPSLPPSYRNLVEAVAHPDVSIRELGSMVEADAAMSIKVLQVVNSAFFGLNQRVPTVGAAVNELSINMLKALTLTAHVFQAFEGSGARGFSLERFQAYSIRVARMARRFASTPELVEDAFIASVARDLGELAMAVQSPRDYARVIQRVAETNEMGFAVEDEEFGFNHMDVGAQLLAHWGLPIPIVEAVALHHRPQQVTLGPRELLAVVHVADAVTGIRVCGEPPESLQRAFVEQAGFGARLPQWQSLVALDAAAHPPGGRR